MGWGGVGYGASPAVGLSETHTPTTKSLSRLPETQPVQVLTRSWSLQKSPVLELSGCRAPAPPARQEEGAEADPAVQVEAPHLKREPRG